MNEENIKECNSKTYGHTCWLEEGHLEPWHQCDCGEEWKPAKKKKKQSVKKQLKELRQRQAALAEIVETLALNEAEINNDLGLIHRDIAHWSMRVQNLEKTYNSRARNVSITYNKKPAFRRNRDDS